MSKCLKQSSLGEHHKKTFQNKSWHVDGQDMKYECEAGYRWSILGKLG